MHSNGIAMCSEQRLRSIGSEDEYNFAEDSNKDGDDDEAMMFKTVQVMIFWSAYVMIRKKGFRGLHITYLLLNAN